MKNVNLGDEVKDKVTGFKGTAIGKTTFLFGCTRVGVQPKVDKDGKVSDASWFDEPQLEVLKKAVVKVANEEQRKVGGPMVSIPTRNKSK